jgi:type IV pilus assembly protein PilN
MIRVNLLQIKRKKKAKPLPSFVVLGILLAVVVCLVVGLIWTSQTNKISKLNRTKMSNQARINELKEKVKEVNDYEAKIKQFQERKNVIVSLREGQGIPVMVMNELSFQLADGVWLGKMDIKDANVSINGFAFTNSNVVEFVNNLKRSKLFSNVYLMETRQGKTDKVEVFAFKLTFSINQK